LVEKILRDAKKEADETIERSRKTAQEVLDEKREEARKKGERESESLIKAAEDQARSIIESSIANSRIRMNWMILSEKEKIIDRVFDEVKKKLREFTRTNEYDKILKSLIEEGATAAGGGELQVYLNRYDYQRNLGLDQLSDNIEKATGVRTALRKATETAETIGGALIKSKDGKVAVDNTLEALIESRRKDLEPKISALLFAKSD
jgi:V/A-type H+-transporting ATPase subunit E